MAAPLPAPTAAPVTVPQAVITIASSDNPTITAKARNAAIVVDHVCMVFRCVITLSLEAPPPSLLMLRRPAAYVYGATDTQAALSPWARSLACLDKSGK